MYCIESKYMIAIYDLSRAMSAPPVHLWIPSQLLYVPAAHMVSCNGNLLLVVLFSSPDDVVVYKLGPLELGMGQWEIDLGESERVTDLGGYSLFLGRSDAYALSAEEHPAIRGNCIYYVEQEHDRFQEKREWAFVFDLKSQKVVEEIPFPREHMENRETKWWPCFWFCPRKPIC